MAAIATLEELKQVANELESLKMKNPEIYKDFAELFRRNRVVGYKNICIMLLGEATPSKLKGLEE